MGFNINGGSFYPPLSMASRVQGQVTLSVRPQAQFLFTRAQVGQVGLTSASYSANEGTLLTFTVARSSGASGSIAVDYAFAGLTDGQPTAPSGTVTWNDGDSAPKGVTVQMGVVAATRNGTLTLSNPRSLSGGAAPTITGTNPASVQVVNVISAPASDVTTFSVVGSGSQFISIGSYFKAGDVPSGLVPVLTDNSNNVLTGFQSQVRTSHPDGSVRHAVMHAQVAGGQSYKIRTGAPATGTTKTVAAFLAAVSGSLARVLITGGATGTCDLRDLLSSPTNRAVMTSDATANLRTIEAGPNVLALRVAQNVGTHLRVNFEVRWYGGTVYWVDVWVVNGYANLAGQGAASYTGQVEINGALQPAEDFSTTTHKNHTCWHASQRLEQEGFWSGQAGDLYPQLNTRYLQATKAVPNYRRVQLPSTVFKNALPRTCAPMDNCEIPDAIDATGPGGHIGLCTQWDANYLKSDGDVRCYRNLMANTNGSGAYSVWLLSSVTGEFMTEVEFPNASWNEQVGYGAGCFTGLSPFPESQYSSHLPSIGFLAYGITGNQFHLDAMNAWVTLENMWTSRSNNFTYQTKNYRKHYEPSLRGQGWQYRSNAQAAYANPDTHFHKAYFNKWVEAVAVTFDIPFYGPGGSRRVAIGGAYCAEGNLDYRLFFHLFWQASLAYACLDLGFSVLLPVAQYASILVAGMFGNTGEFPFELAPRQSLKLGATDNTAGPSTDTFYASFTEVRTQNAIPAGESGTLAMATIASNAESGPDHTGSRNETIRQNADPTGYFANFLGALSYLHRLDVPGGFECYMRGTFSTVQPDFTNVGQFDIGMREVDLPAYIRNAAPLTWTQIPSTLMSSATPANYPGDPSARVYAWGGMALRHIGSEIRFVAAGGHGDSSANDVTRLRLLSENPGWVTERTPTLPATPTGGSHFGDGRPNSRHIYYDQQYHNGRDLHIMHGATFVATNANAFDTVDAYSPALGDYLPAGTFPTSAGAAGVGAKAMNPASGCIYYVSGGGSMRFGRWSINAGTAILATPGGFGEQYKAAAIDPIRGVLLHSRDAANNGWRSYSIDTGVSTARSPETSPGLTATQQSQLTQNGGGHEWDLRGERYLYYPSGQDVLAIDPSTFLATPLGLAGTPPPASTPNGLFSRFRYSPELDICAVVSNYGNNVYFFKFAATQRPIPRG